MTICIAALCEQGKSCVVASDRMTVYDYTRVTERKLEDHTDKFHSVGPRAVLLHSGLTRDTVYIREYLKDRIRNFNSVLISDLEVAIQGLFERKRNVEVFQLLGGQYSFGELVKAVGSMTSGPLYEVWQETRKKGISGYVGQFVLVAWANPQYEIHLYGDQPAGEPTKIETAFQCIGSGWLPATSAFVFQKYTMELDLKDALFQVYCAKKAAEVNTGVGEATDLAYLKSDTEQLTALSSEAVGVLERYRKARQKLTVEEDSEFATMLHGQQ